MVSPAQADGQTDVEPALDTSIRSNIEPLLGNEQQLELPLQPDEAFRYTEFLPKEHLDSFFCVEFVLENESNFSLS